MLDPRFWSVGRAADSCLILGFIVFFIKALLFLDARRPPAWRSTRHAFLVWERSFIIAAIVLTAIGFELLGAQLQNTDGPLLARTGEAAYFFSRILGVTAEALDLTRKEQSFYPLTVIHVILAFLAQAAIGASLLQAWLVPAWIRWATIVWNLVWLVVLLWITRRDIDIPFYVSSHASLDRYCTIGGETVPKF